MSGRISLTEKEYDLFQQISNVEDDDAVALLFEHYGSSAKKLMKDFAAFLQEEGLEESEEGIRLSELIAIEAERKKREPKFYTQEIMRVITVVAADRFDIGQHLRVKNDERNVLINAERLLKALKNKKDKDVLLNDLEEAIKGSPMEKTINLNKSSDKKTEHHFYGGGEFDESIIPQTINQEDLIELLKQQKNIENPDELNA